MAKTKQQKREEAIQRARESTGRYRQRFLDVIQNEHRESDVPYAADVTLRFIRNMTNSMCDQHGNPVDKVGLEDAISDIRAMYNRAFKKPLSYSHVG